MTIPRRNPAPISISVHMDADEETWDPKDKHYYYYALKEWCQRRGLDMSNYESIDSLPWCGVRFLCEACRKYDARECYEGDCSPSATHVCLRDRRRRVWSVGQGIIMKFGHTKGVTKPET